MSCPLNKPAHFEEAFYGSVTVGERGQIVIPAEARHELGIEPGDKVLVMRHPIHKGLMLFQLNAVKEFLDEFASQVQRMEAISKDDATENPTADVLDNATPKGREN